MRNIMIAALAALVFLPGCAALQSTLGPLVPNVEVGVNDEGVNFKVDHTVGLSSFCVDPDGVVSQVLNSVPFVGGLANKAVVGVVGNCEVETE